MAWAPDYVTVDELKHYVGISDTPDDDELEFAISAASRAVDNHCNRQFGKVAVAEERVYTAEARLDRGRWVVPIDDLMTTVDLVVSVDSDVTTDYRLEPRNAAASGRPWTRLVVDTDAAYVPTGCEYEIAATGLWGWSAVPVAVRQSTLLQATRFFKRRGSAFGVAGNNEFGTVRLLAKLDADLMVMLRAYRRPRRPA